MIALNSACHPVAALAVNHPQPATHPVTKRSAAANQTPTTATRTVPKTDRLSSVALFAVAHSADPGYSARVAPSAAAVVQPHAAASPAASAPGNSAADYAADSPTPLGAWLTRR